MECLQVMLDRRQAKLDAIEPMMHLSLDFIQLTMHTSGHFMVEVFRLISHVAIITTAIRMKQAKRSGAFTVSRAKAPALPDGFPGRSSARRARPVPDLPGLVMLQVIAGDVQTGGAFIEHLRRNQDAAVQPPQQGKDLLRRRNALWHGVRLPYRSHPASRNHTSAGFPQIHGGRDPSVVALL